MSSNHSPHVVKTLRHWAVAGVAALMAVAWVAISLVVPSSADGIRFGAGFTSQVNLGVQVQQRGFEGRALTKVNGASIIGFQRLMGLPAGGVTEYDNGTAGVCFEHDVPGVNTNYVGGGFVFAGQSGLVGYGDFGLSVAQQRMVRALSYYYRTLQSSYDTFPYRISGRAYRYDYGTFQRVAWAISRGVEARYVYGRLTRGEQDQREKAQHLWELVYQNYRKFQTNSELLKSIKIQITTVAQGQQRVRLVGSKEAIQALYEAGISNAILVVNGQYLSVEQALGQGVLINGSCVNGHTTVHARFSADMKMEGLFAVAAIGERDQVKLLLGQRSIHVAGSASVTVSCGVPPTATTTTTTSTHTTPATPVTTPPKTTPTTPKTTPTTPQTTPVTPVTTPTPTTPSKTTPTPTTPKTTPTTPSTTPVTPVTTPTPTTPSTTPTPTTPSKTTPTPTTPKTTPPSTTPVTPVTTPTPPTTTPVKTPPPVKPAVTGFTVRKQAAQGGPGVNVPKQFHFAYYCGDHAPGASDWRSLAAVSVGDAGNRVQNVPVGATCYVREDNADVAGAHLVRSWTVNGVPVANGDSQLLVDSRGNAVGVKFTASKDTTTQLALVNSYSPMGGKLLLAKKQTDGTAAHLAPKQVTMRYVCATGQGADSLVTQGRHTVTANGDAFTLDRVLPVGTVCMVGEDAASVPDTSLTTTYTVDGRTVAATDTTWGGVQLHHVVRASAVADGATVKVVANNTYMDRTAGFSLTKKLADDYPAAKQATFAFGYSCTTGGGAPVTGDFKLGVGQTFVSSSVPALHGLRKGSTCRITEKTPSVPGLVFDSVLYTRPGKSGADFHKSEHDPATLVFTLTGSGDPVAFTATNSFKPTQRTPKPEIKTVLEGPAGVTTVDLAKAGDTVRLVDTIHYKGLLAGKTYYLHGKLVDASSNELGVSVVAQLVPKGNPGELVEGDYPMVFNAPKRLLLGKTKVVAFERLWNDTDLRKVQPGTPGVATPFKADATPPALHEDVHSPSQTVNLRQPPKPTAKAHVDLVKRVVAKGLQVPADRDYVFDLNCGTKGQPGFVSDEVKLRADARVSREVPVGVTCSISEHAAPVQGVPNNVHYTVSGVEHFDASAANTVSFTVPAAGAGHVQVIAENGYYHKVPKPEVGTSASNAANGTRQVPYGVDATIKDVMQWTNLPAGSYVMVPTLVRNVAGQAQAVAGVNAAAIPFSVAAGQKQGTVTAQIAVPAKQVTPDSSFVVFERVYRADQYSDGKVVEGAVVVASHEDVNDKGQTVNVAHKTTQPAHIRLLKTVAGADAAGHQFQFSVNCTAKGEQPLATTVKVAAGEASQDIPAVAGATCTVSEDRDRAMLENVGAPNVTWTADSGVTLSNQGPFTVSFVVPKAGGTVQLHALNSYTPNTSTPGTTPPCTTPATPGTPGTPGTATTPGKPGTSTTPGKPGTPTTPECPPVTTPPCTTPATPGTPGTPGTATTPGKPGTSTTPGKPGTPGTPTTPQCPPVTTPPCTTPATPGTPGTHGTPGKPGTPGTPGTPTTPECPPVSTPSVSTPPATHGTPSTTPPCTTPATPGTHGTPGKPGTPGTPTTPECPPVNTPPATHGTPSTTPPCTTPATPGTPGTNGTPGTPGTPATPVCPPNSGIIPSVLTVARDGFDGDKLLAAGHEATVRDRVRISGLAAGSYTLVGTLMDKDTGAAVPGAAVVAPVTFTVGANQEVTQFVYFKVPAAAVRPGARFVVFESVYPAANVDATGAAKGMPVATHHNLSDAAQTVTVAPTRTLVPPAVGHSGGFTPLAKTGVATGTLAILLGGLVLVGAAMVRLRRRNG